MAVLQILCIYLFLAAVCSVRGDKPQRTLKTIGQDLVEDISQYPYMAFLVSRLSDPFKTYCAAVLIDPRVIITTAHCVWNHDLQFSNEKSEVYAATVNSSRPQKIKNIKEINIKQIKLPNSRADCGSDIAIAVVELNEPFGFDKYTAAAVLPEPSNIGDDLSALNKIFLAGQECTAIGWEWAEDNVNPSFVLRKYAVKTVDDPKCVLEKMKHYDKVSDKCAEALFCIHDSSESGICGSDSGGPLICNGVVMGIASYSSVFGDKFSCDKGNNTITYTRVSMYADIINGILKHVNSSSAMHFNKFSLLVIFPLVLYKRYI